MILRRGKYFSHAVQAIDKKYPTGPKLKEAKANGTYTYKYIKDHDLNPVDPDGIEDYNLVSSISEVSIDPNKMMNKETFIHYPAIDIDFPVYAVPSRTPGHTHLYIEKPILWEKYLKLLHAMAECGIIEQGYYDAAKKKGMTLLRSESYKELLKIEEKLKIAKEISETTFSNTDYNSF